MQPNSPPQQEEGGRTMSFAGPGAEAYFNEPSPQYQGMQSERLELAVHSQTAPDEQLTMMHESWS